MKSYILIPMVLLCFISCKKAVEQRFSHSANIYFDIYNAEKDSIVTTFAYNPNLAQDTVWLPVRISGVRMDKSRTFKVRVEKDSATAKEGIHYEALKSSYTVNPNSWGAYLPVVIYNKDPELENRSVSIIIKLIASDDFGIENPYLIRAKVVFSAKLEKPDWWDTWPLTPYSRVKHELFILVTGQTSLTTAGQDAPKNLYLVGLLTTMLNNPSKWVQNNAAKGYVLEEVVPGDVTNYYFYNTGNPAKKTILRKNPQSGKYFFIDENGNEVI